MRERERGGGIKGDCEIICCRLCCEAFVSSIFIMHGKTAIYNRTFLSTRCRQPHTLHDVMSSGLSDIIMTTSNLANTCNNTFYFAVVPDP